MGREPSDREPSGLVSGVSAPELVTSGLGREPSGREPSGLGAAVTPGMETSRLEREPSSREPSGLTSSPVPGVQSADKKGLGLDIEIEIQRKAREPSAAPAVDGTIVGREPSDQQPSGVIVAEPTTRDPSQLAAGISVTGREPSVVPTAFTSTSSLEPKIEPYTVRGSSLLVPTQEGIYPPIRREFEPQVAYRPSADRFVEQIGQVASQVAATTRQPVTITFRPTIVIIQNFISLPLDVLKARQAAFGNEQIVNIQNQEVFVYPNSINVSNLSATYSQNIESTEPFLHFIDSSTNTTPTEKRQQSEKQLPQQPSQQQ